MFENDVRSIVSKSITAHSKGDTISKSELEDILTDILCKLTNSKDITRSVDRKKELQQKAEQMIKTGHQ